jgi:hypothetical protein
VNLETIILRKHKPVIEELLLYDFIRMKCPTHEQSISDTLKDLWSCWTGGRVEEKGE